MESRASRASWLFAYVLAYALGSIDLISHLLGDLRRRQWKFDIDLLMLIAALGAAILGAWHEGALLLFLFSLGHALQHYALGRARRAIESLRELAPTRAVVLREVDGLLTEEVVDIERVMPGDVVVVRPAERIAVDGGIIEGRSGVNQAAVTGESIPVDKEVGDNVYAGTVNGDGTLKVRVMAAVGDRTLDRVVRLVAESRNQQAPSQELTRRFERVFVPLVLVFDVLLAVIPPLAGIWTWSEACYRAMALLVAASPCALALGTPAAVLSGIAQGARRGVLIKGGAYLERLAALRILALDKTGTITTGEPEVTDLVPALQVSEVELLTTAAAVEIRSQHPLARAIVRETARRDIQVKPADKVQAVNGMGVTGVIDSHTVALGRAAMFDRAGVDIPADMRGAVLRLEADGRSTILVRRSDQAGECGSWLGAIGLADQLRPHVSDIIKQLRKGGINRLVMLTGDNEGVARAVGGTIGFDEIRSALLPEGKVQAIRELMKVGPVGMVGDGVNDAPALAAATVGIAMGGAGTAAALETADVALMADDLGRLPFAIGLSHATRAVIRQNIAIALVVIIILVFGTVSGISSIGLTVVVHEGSTLMVVANALRLLAFEQGSATVTHFGARQL